MSHYPFPELTKLLKFHASPEQYQYLVRQTRDHPGTEEKTARLLEIIPSYMLARCPYCDTGCYYKFDTYSLQKYRDHQKIGYKWSLDRSIGAREDFPENPPCKHFLGTQDFFNLHGAETLPIKGYTIKSGEVPYLTRDIFYNQAFQAYAVIHALPICNIQNNTFIPAYTIYFLTYFLSDPNQYIRYYFERVEELYKPFREWEEKARARGEDVSDITFHSPHLIDPPAAGDFDLTAAAETGRLGWLDVSNPINLPLVIGNELKLPSRYQDIQGRRRQFYWNKNRQTFIVYPD